MPTPAPSDTQPLPALRGMDLKAMTALVQRGGQPAYRGKQILQWVYEKGVRSFDEMTNLSKDLRAWMAQNVRLGGAECVEMAGEPDETQKLLFRTADNEYIESVLMRDDFLAAGDDDAQDESAPSGSTAAMDKASLCVSSQVGCALRCAFCATGHGGFRRDLTTDEILSQVIEARHALRPNERLANLVFMGMGEPLLNLAAVVPALRLLTSPQAFALSTRRVIVSTAGVVPGIQALGQSDTGVNLAVSLNATTQSLRDKLMPGVKKWPIPELLKACKNYPMAKRRRVTIEYVLLKGLNDTLEDARRLAGMLSPLYCMVNLIVYNASKGIEFQATDERRAEVFREALDKAGVYVSLRRSKGYRLDAACGQLAAHARKRGGRV